MMMSCRLRTRSPRAILTAMPLVAGIQLCSMAITQTSSMKDIGTPLMPITTMSIEPPAEAAEEHRMTTSPVTKADTKAKPSGSQRKTRQRAAVEEILSDRHDFRTAQQIHDGLRHHGERIGLTTVYRTLQLMAESGDVDAIRTNEGETAYRRCSTGHHHHLVCRTCGRTVEVSGPAVERWANAVAEQHGFREISHDLEIFGTCNTC
jgi:Fur family ferric uptake transcriptional regulator